MIDWAFSKTAELAGLEGRDHVKRMMIPMAASYAALLVVIAGLSVALQRERARRCIPIPEVPKGVRRKVSALVSRATDTAESVAEKAVHAVR
jgi:hypothetical protein